MAKEAYIDKHQLGDRIAQMSFNEGVSDTEIARLLSEEGHHLSQPTVSRWLKAKRESMGDRVKGIMQQHLEEKLPGNLNALEEMEGMTLGWVREGQGVLTESLMDPAWCSDAFLRWHGMILNAVKEEEKAAVSRGIIKEALNRVLAFFDIRKEKLAFIKSTRESIGLKLQYAGIIEGSEKGNIIIMTQKRGDGSPKGQGQKAEPGEKPRLQMVLKGNKPDNAQ